MHDERRMEEYDLLVNGIKRNNPLIEFNVPKINRVDFEKLFKNIHIRIWDRLSFGWNQGFSLLLEYVNEFGTSRVKRPFVYKDFPLWSWTSRRREDYRKGKLDKEKILQLEALPDWTWDARKDDKETGLRTLRQFTKREKHSDVPNNHLEGDFKLGKWVTNLRSRFRYQKLEPDLIKALENIPFWTWKRISNFETKFHKNFSILLKFVAREGHAKVPANHIEDGFRLGGWVTNQRSKYFDRRLSDPNKIAKLEGIPGWTWNTIEDDLKVGLSAIKAFTKENGHSFIPAKAIINGYPIGRWASRRRSEYARGMMETKRIKEFENIDHWV